MGKHAEHTKKLIEDTLIDLMNDKNLEKIKVTDITSKLDLHRSTFYEYFADIYEVVDEIEKEYLKVIKDVVEKYSDDFIKCMRSLAIFVKSNRDTFNVLLNKMNFHFNDALFLTAQKIYLNIFLKTEDEQEKKRVLYNSYFVISGSIGILSFWILRNCDISIDEFTSIMGNYLKKRY